MYTFLVSPAAVSKQKQTFGHLPIIQENQESHKGIKALKYQLLKGEEIYYEIRY